MIEIKSFINIGIPVSEYIIKKYKKNLTKLESIFDIIKTNKKAIQYVNNNLPNDSLSKSIYKKLYENNFLCEKCLIWIETKPDIIQIIKLSDKITIYIVDNIKTNSIIIKHIINIVKWIINIAKDNHKLDLYIFLSPYKKNVDSKDTQLSKTNINSGSSFRYHNWIIIYRKEELFKVLIHELVHFTQLDIQNIAPKLDAKCTPILVNEAVTEAIAIVLHSKYYAHYTKSDFNTIVNKEIQYSMMMYHLILYHLKIKNKKDLYNVCLTTNVISYYILKYLILIYPNFINNIFNKKFIKKCVEDIINNIEILDLSFIIDEQLKTKEYKFSCRMSYYDLLTDID
jgi:hypothetical protein